MNNKNPLGLKKIHHVEFFVGNAKQAEFYYRNAFGFSRVAYSGLETGNRDATSYVLRQNRVNFILTTPLHEKTFASEHLKNKILKQKKQGSLTLVTSHNMSEVEELADRVVFLVDGVVKFNLTISELLEGTGESKLGKALAKRMEGEVYA